MKRFLVVLIAVAFTATPALGGSYIVTGESADLVAAAANSLGGEMTWYHEGTGLGFIDIDDSAAADLAAHGDIGLLVEDAEVALPDYDAELAEIVSSDINPDAPQLAFFYPAAWNLRAIGADQAWAAGIFGSSDVTVAVLDTGVDYTHPDLAGLVDLSRSVSFVEFDDFLVSLLYPGYHPIADLRYHGTHVAATIASNADVQAGVTSGLTIMGVKVLGYNGRGSSSDILAGILYASDAGADVINMSLGGAFLKSGSNGYHSIINRVMAYAHQRGAVVVVSAGNNAWDLDHYNELKKDFGLPSAAVYSTYCDAPNVVCVSATGPTSRDGIFGPFYNIDTFAGYSNYGRSAIDVAAPGGWGAPVYAACSRTSLYFNCASGRFVLGAAGTSMASPHVSALAGLLVEQLGKNKPSQVKAALQGGADDLGDSGTDPYYGKGRINIPASLGLE